MIDDKNSPSVKRIVAIKKDKKKKKQMEEKKKDGVCIIA